MILMIVWRALACLAAMLLRAVLVGGLGICVNAASSLAALLVRRQGSDKDEPMA
jgi:hypothetical protein